MAEGCYRKGECVEIKSKEEGFEGSYYEATVIMSFQGTKQYFVEYKTLLTNDQNHLLKEVVDHTEIRPSPPKLLPVSDFCPGDFVDAFDNDGWWVGRIVGRNGDYYEVIFDHWRNFNVMTYPSHRLRPHLDWKKGKWFRPKATSTAAI